MTVTQFLADEVVDFASYSTLRAIASLVDGQKNGARKVINSMRTRSKDTKVSILAGIVAIENEYLHGDISDSIVTMAKNYAGSNNIPLLTREGNFGTRFEPEASANRYIFTGKENIFDKLFNKDDYEVLEHQEFEGTKIEPKFFVPTLPLILINGNMGIATGFKQEILPRDPKVIKDYISSYLKNNSVPDLTPWFKDFNGVIKQGDSSRQWIIEGTFERTSATRIMITELPVGYNLSSYTKVLDTLEEKKKIKGYLDLSEDDIFKFEVQMSSVDVRKDDSWIINELKLFKKTSELYVVLDEHNIVNTYSSAKEILNKYIEIKLVYLQKRKDFLIQKLTRNLHLMASKYLFIKGVTENKIIVNKKKKDEIIVQLDKEENIKIIKDEDSYDYLLRMSIYSLTQEKMDELTTKIKDMKGELDIVKVTTIEDTWSKEIDSI